MDYFIKADIDTDCDDDFPESLSNFLEQYPVSDFQGEARQISKILNINLDPFFVYGTGYEGPEEEQKFWQDLAAFEALVDSFLSKIAENKEYYKQVRYNSAADSLREQMHDLLLHKKDEESLARAFQLLHESPDVSFPTDRGYLSSNRIVDDLNALKALLNSYKHAGATKIMLSYG